MSGGIFLLQDEGLVEMRERQYDSEDLLQVLLEKYPRLLGPADQSAGSSGRWLLVKREEGVPDQEAGADRWSLITCSSSKGACQRWLKSSEART